MNDDINRRLHEALGKCWHEVIAIATSRFGYAESPICKCGAWNCQVPNPDYCADPRLVIEAMREREKFKEFIYFVLGPYGDVFNLLDLIMDTTGKLRDAAIEFIEGRKG